MTEVDARGLSCPLPVMRTEAAVFDKAGEIRVFVDSGTAKQNVTNLLKDAGYEVIVDERDDEWVVNAKKA